MKEIYNKIVIEKINKTNNLFFEGIDKVDKTLV